MSTHKIVTSPANSTKLNVTVVQSDAELKTQLQNIQTDKGKRLWWFSSEESKEQKKEQGS